MIYLKTGTLEKEDSEHVRKYVDQTSLFVIEDDMLHYVH